MHHRSFRALTFAILIGATAVVSSGPAFASATPSTSTSHVTQTLPYPPPPPPCNASGGFVDIDANVVVHLNTLPDGRMFVHGTTAGTFAAHPFVGLDSTGHFVFEHSDTIVGTTFTQHIVQMINGRDTSGTHAQFHFVADITT